MATQDTPFDSHLRRTRSQEVVRKQRELFLFFRISTLLLFTGFCVVLPIYIYAAHEYTNFCRVPLASWQWAFTIFLWCLLASFILAYMCNRFFIDRATPGNVAYLPVVVVYLLTAAWVIYGTVLVPLSYGVDCDSGLQQSSLGIIIAAWGCLFILGCCEGLSSFLVTRQAPKTGVLDVPTNRGNGVQVAGNRAPVGAVPFSTYTTFVVGHSDATTMDTRAALPILQPARAPQQSALQLNHPVPASVTVASGPSAV